MFDQLLGLVLLGLGIKSPVTGQAVKGDTTEAVELVIEEDSGSIDNKGGSKSAGREAKQPKKRPSLIEKVFQARESSPSGGQNAKGGAQFRPRLVKDARLRAIQETMQQKNDAFKVQLEANQLKAQTQLETRKEVFQQQLETITDEQKKAVVSKMQEQMTLLNTKWVEKMTQNLQKINEILGHVVEKAGTEKEKGTNTTNVDSAVGTAQAAIQAVQVALSAQSAKTYVVDIASEQTVKNDVSTVRRTLAADIKSIHVKVVAARKAVGEAIRALALARGETVPERIIK